MMVLTMMELISYDAKSDKKEINEQNNYRLWKAKKVNMTTFDR